MERRRSMQAESELTKSIAYRAVSVFIAKSDPKLTDVFARLQEMRLENKEKIKRLETDLAKCVETCTEKCMILKTRCGFTIKH